LLVWYGLIPVVEADPHGAWLETDDCNDVTGKPGADVRIVINVHYTDDGYKLLGELFANKAIELIKKSTP
jgi:hypothetical protein